MIDIDPTKNLEIDKVWPVSTEVVKNGGIGVDWVSDAGWGQCVVYWGDDGKLHADTECMCSDKDKSFLKAILNLVAEQVEIDS